MDVPKLNRGHDPIRLIDRQLKVELFQFLLAKVCVCGLSFQSHLFHSRSK